MRIYFTIACLVFLSLPGFSQFPDRFKEPEWKPDTLYFPFRQGTQMIMIDHEAAWQAKVDWHEGTQPRAMSWSALIPKTDENVYIFRDSSGKIIYAYNNKLSIAGLQKIFGSVPVSKPPTVMSHAYPVRMPVDFRGLTYQTYFPRTRTTHMGGFYRVYSSMPVKQRHLPRQQGSSANIGLIDSLGRLIFPYEFDVIEKAGPHFLVAKNQRYGILDASMKPVLPLAYDMIRQPGQDVVIFSKNGIISVMYDLKQAALISINDYDWIDENYLDDMKTNPLLPLVRFTKNGRYGFINASYKPIVPPVYDFAHPVFRDGLALVNRNGKWGYVNVKGHEQIACQYDDADVFDKGVANVRIDGRVTCINTNGVEVSGCNAAYFKWETENDWNCGKSFSHRRSIVRRNQSHGLTDRKNKLVVPLIYERIQPITTNSADQHCHPDYFKVCQNRKWGVIDTDGKIILPCIYDMIDDYKGGIDLLQIQKNGLFGLLDKKMQWVIPCRYEALNPYSIKGVLIFSKNQKWGWMTMQEQVIVQPQFDQVYWIKNGVVKVTKDRKSGMLDSLGRIIIPVVYKELGDEFHNGLLMALRDEKWGFIDSTGQTQVPFQFDEVRRFEKNITGAKRQDKYGFINRNGEWVVKPEYDFVDHYWTSIGQIKVMKGKKFGFVNESGILVLPCIYDDVTGYHPQKGHYVKLNGQWMYVK